MKCVKCGKEMTDASERTLIRKEIDSLSNSLQIKLGRVRVTLENALSFIKSAEVVGNEIRWSPEKSFKHSDMMPLLRGAERVFGNRSVHGQINLCVDALQELLNAYKKE